MSDALKRWQPFLWGLGTGLPIFALLLAHAPGLCP
jgi:hypothetical protein